MNIFQAAILGVVEGVTEFLPISSTYHLIITSSLLGIPQTDFVKLFEVFIQAGAITAVLLLYGKELLKNKELMKKVLISFIPTAIIGFILYKVIKDVFFESTLLMITVFIGMGIVFLLVEYLVKKRKLNLTKSIHELTWKDAFFIGLIQACAVVPGVSRAGAVIVGLMFFRFRRDESAKYSFLLAVPTILIASLYDLFKMRHLLVDQGNNVVLLLTGTVFAFISAYIVIRWFIGFLKHHTLTIFALYRFVVAIILIVLGLLKLL